MSSLKPRFSELQTEIIQHTRHAFEKTRNFHGRYAEMDVLRDYIASDTHKPFVVWGGQGVGKSTLVAKATEMVCEKKNKYVHVV